LANRILFRILPRFPSKSSAHWFSEHVATFANNPIHNDVLSDDDGQIQGLGGKRLGSRGKIDCSFFLVVVDTLLKKDVMTCSS